MSYVQQNTLQKVDPLAALTSWDTTVVLALIAWVYSLFASLADVGRGHNVALLLVAVILLTCGLFLHLWFAVPRHAPYSRTRYIFVVLTVLAASALQLLSISEVEHFTILDWGPIALALVLATASGYRPLVDQYVAGITVLFVMGTLLAWVGSRDQLLYGLPFFVISGLVVIVLVVVGQASYTRKALKILYSWLEASVFTRQKNDSLIQDVRLTSLTNAQDFLISVLEKGNISRSDVTSSRKLAQEVREELITFSSQSWLEHAGYEISDPQSLVSEWLLPAQTTFLAFLDQLKEQELSDIKISVTDEKSARRMSIVVLARTPQGDVVNLNKLRSALSPYLRVMYVVFDHVRLMSDSDTVKVMFYYVR